MKFTLFTMAFALFAMLPFSAQADETTTSEVMPVIKAVAFHSDNCGSCKILGPRIMKAKEAINPDKLSVVKFDFTNSETIEATKTLATQKGVNHVLQKYGAKTGFVILVNNAGEEVDTLKVDDNTADIAAKLATAIANAS